ncbi:hypothetical protein [Ferrimonas marina]|nr:hypothetical protein [Ferrimonas marina]
MGEPNTSELEKTAKLALERIAKHFGPMRDITLKFHSVNYNVHFEQIRDMWKKSASDFSNKLSKGGVTGIKTNRIGDLVNTLTNVTNNAANNDGFLYTHMLDTLLYKTHFRGLINESVLEQLARILRTQQTSRSNMHLVAFSLGTAVIRDAFELMSSDEYRQFQTEGAYGSITLLSDVGGFVSEHSGELDRLKPLSFFDADGVTKALITVKHKFDPISMIRPFVAPQGWRGLISTQGHLDITLESLEGFEDGKFVITHDIGHYLRNPRCTIPLLRCIFDGRLSLDEAKTTAAFNEYYNSTFNVNNIELTDLVSELQDSLGQSDDNWPIQFSGVTNPKEAIVELAKLLSSAPTVEKLMK